MNTRQTKIRIPAPLSPIKVLSGLVIGGSLVGATMILLSGPFSQNYRSEALASVEAPQPQWAQKFEAPKVVPEAPAVEITAEPVEAKRPVVALENDEKDVDHEAAARRQMDEGDLKNAFSSLRKHLYNEAPTREVLLQLGNIGREIGELALAEQALLDAVAIDPSGADIQTELARVLFDAGELERARIAARQAIRLDGEDASAWNVAGRVAMGQSQFDRAESAFTKALELDPMDPMIHNNAGLLYLYMKQGTRAVDALETAVELYDDQAPAFVLNNLGLAHELAGNLEESRQAFEEALLINPFYARAKVNLRRIETTIAQQASVKSFDTATGPKASEVDPSEGAEVGDDG